MAKSTAAERLHDNLLRAASDDWESLRYARDRSEEHKKMLAGKWSIEDGSEKPVPINKFALLQIVMVPVLAGKAPAVYVNTKRPELREVSLSYELALPIRMKELRWESVMRKAVIHSLYDALGIVKAGRHVLGNYAIDDDEEAMATKTKPYLRNVSLKNFIFDNQVDEWCDTQYAADLVHVDYELLMDTQEIDEATANAIKAECDPGQSASAKSPKHRGQFRPTVPVWSFWCRYEKCVKLFYAPGGEVKRGMFMSEDGYTGPVDGPYHFLHYNDIPDEILALSPAAILRDATMLINMAWNKAARQAELQKTLYAYRNAVDANTARTLGDGETYSPQQGNTFTQERFGGADQANIGMAMTADNVFDSLGYPLGLLGGAAASSETATQDSILQGNAGRSIGQMAYRNHEFQRSAIYHVAEDMWDDPEFDPDIQYQVPGTRLAFPMSFAPEDRYGEFPQYDIDLVPFSTMSLSPQEKWSQIGQFTQSFILPSLGIMGQQGDQFNFREFINGWAKANNCDGEMDRLLISAERQQPASQDEQRKPSVTTRQNVRVNKSGNRQAQGQALAQMLMSQQQQAPSGGATY